jgi:acyl carrier protein
MLNRILNIISNYVDVPRESYNEDTNIFDLGIDSLRMLKIIIDLEEYYNVKFEDKEIVDIRNASDIEKIILEKRA